MHVACFHFHLFRHAFARTAEMNVSFTTKTAFNQIRRENGGLGRSKQAKNTTGRV